MYLKPDEIVSYVNDTAFKKSKTSSKKTFISAILGGAYIAMGSLLALYVGGNIAELETNNPGLQKFIFGAVFPLGLILVAIMGAELFTGNTSYFVPSFLSRKMKAYSIIRNWFWVYIGNFVGSIIVAWLFAYYTHMLSGTHAEDYAISLGIKKVSSGFMVTLVKGIACNWMVALAMWMSFAAKTVGGKAFAAWLPVMAFVTMGLEHSIANMFFIPTAIFYGADISIQSFLFDNLLPVTIGNIIGGGIFVGAVYWFIHEKK